MLTFHADSVHVLDLLARIIHLLTDARLIPLQKTLLANVKLDTLEQDVMSVQTIIMETQKFQVVVVSLVTVTITLICLDQEIVIHILGNVLIVSMIRLVITAKFVGQAFSDTPLMEFVNHAYVMLWEQTGLQKNVIR